MRIRSLFIVASSFLIASALGAPQNEAPGVEIPKDRPTNPPTSPGEHVSTQNFSDDDLNLIAYCISEREEASCQAFLRMAHYFLTGRLRTDPILREYLDNLERSPVTQVITATSVYSEVKNVIGTQTYSKDYIANEISVETFYHGASGTDTEDIEPTLGSGNGQDGNGQDGNPPLNVISQGPPQPTQLIPITETIIETLRDTLTETETILSTFTAPPELIYLTKTITQNAPPPELVIVTETVTHNAPTPELVIATETVTQNAPTPELVIATETVTQNAPPELIYVTETVVQDAASFYTVPPELVYLTETITQHAPPPQIVYTTETITENHVSVSTAPAEFVNVTENATITAPLLGHNAPPPSSYECKNLIQQPSVQQCFINNGYIHLDFPKNNCNQLQVFVNKYSESFEACYNGFPFNNTTCNNEPTTVTEILAASTSAIHVAEETKYVNVGTCGTCDSDKSTDSNTNSSNTNNNNNNIINNIYNSFISENDGAGGGYYYQGGSEYPSYGDYEYGGYINYKGVKAWSTPYGIYFTNGTRISFHADCSYDKTTQTNIGSGSSGTSGKGNSTSGLINGSSNANRTVILAEGATLTDYYDVPCTDDVPYVDPAQCSVTAVTHPEDCTETDMHQHDDY